MRIISGDTTILFLAAALFLAASPINSSANPVDITNPPEPKKKQWLGSAHDSMCSDVMCIECDVDSATARYILRSTGMHRLGWMGIGFGRNMGDSPMVVVWLSRGADDLFDSVTLSQRKAPYETMPTPDPDPPFVAKLSLTNTSISEEHVQIAFTRRAPRDGVQNIIWAYSRTPPGSEDANVHIAIHHNVGRATLNLTRIAPEVVEPVLIEPPPAPAAAESDAVPVAAVGLEESDEVIEDVRVSESEIHIGGGGGGGGFASILHGALCVVGFLLVLPFGVLVVRHAKATGNPSAFQLHRLLQFGVAGGFITGGTLAYLYMGTDGSGAALAHKVGGTGLLFLYVVQCAIGNWVYRIPRWSRTRVHRVSLAGMGVIIVLLAFYQTWLGLVAAGRDKLVWLILLIFLLSLYVIGVVMAKRRLESVEVSEKGEYVVLDTHPPDDGLADGGEKL